LSEAQFIEVCDGCGDCVSACPEKILISARGRYPKVDFAKGECTFCKACLDCCPTEALKESESPWHYVAEIKPECLSKSGVMCRTCGDVCDSRAITFKFELGGVSVPELDLEKCTGCGACLALCPVGSIEMTSSAMLAAQKTENSIDSNR
jgi:ferredoxin-type protein NapF